jgi:hypothetical protein
MFYRSFSLLLATRSACLPSAAAVLLAASVLVGCDSSSSGGGEEEDPEPATVQFAAADATVSEDDGAAALTVEIAEAGDESVSVDVVFDEDTGDATASDVGDYATERVTFSANASSGATREVTVPLTDDREQEETETATFALQDASGDAEIATPEAFTLDIEDDGDIPTPPNRP